MSKGTEDKAIRSVIILGGGTAGWMSASILARFFPAGTCNVTLVESEEIGTVGVGEASVPVLRNFNGVLGVDERDFIKATNGTFKLGIEFRDWGAIGQNHFHGFGDYGDLIEGVAPHHHWLKLHRSGDMTPIGDYSFPYTLARRNRFAPPEMLQGEDDYNYAFHFDAGLYARFLRGYAEARGVVRLEGKVKTAELDAETGHISHIVTEDGETLAADFFIDCSGFRGLLIEETLQTGYEDWRHWLPCDRAVVVPSELDGIAVPYTVSTAKDAGWQWRIPLQHRMGNGYVYSSSYVSEEDALQSMLNSLTGKPLADPRVLKFITGRRKKIWNKNCVAVGLAGGFMEPLESTSIQLIQTALARLIEFFPDKNFDPRIEAEYNRQTVNEFERIRDFLIVHYCLTKRSDSAFWNYCRTMDVPDTLKHKIDVFEATGSVPLMAEESYQEPSWVAIFTGNSFLPKRYDPLVDLIEESRLRAGMKTRRDALVRKADSVPTQAAFIERYCQARVA